MTPMKTPVTLLIPEKTDIEFEEVWAAWTENGGRIRRLGKYWIRDEELARQPIAIYGNQTFALVLAQIYHVTLLAPDDTLIARLSKEWTKRDIRLKQISDINAADFPVFIKPVIPKIFLAGIFQSLAAFELTTKGLQATEPVLVSGIVADIEAEARSFIRNGVVLDIALYEGHADLVSGKDFVTDFIQHHQEALPAVVVVDIAYSKEAGWFILEFNACWVAGLNNCSAALVMDCILEATVMAVT